MLGAPIIYPDAGRGNWDAFRIGNQERICEHQFSLGQLNGNDHDKRLNKAYQSNSCSIEIRKR